MYEYTDSAISARLMIQMLQFCSFCRRNQMATAQKVFLFFRLKTTVTNVRDFAATTAGFHFLLIATV